MRAFLLTVVLTLGLGLGLAAAPASAIENSWVEGRSDQDTVLSCIGGSPQTGALASVAWRPRGDHVPEVGEVFDVRMSVALVGQSCTKLGTWVELLAPHGLRYADETRDPVRWGIRRIGDPVRLRTGGLSYQPGLNGGVAILAEGETPFVLDLGQVLEIEVSVIADRELHGKATREPECPDRRDGTRPCPVTEAGDHFQAAFRVFGHGGEKSYLTPYVGLFAQPARTAPAPELAASATTATWKVAARRATVVVRSAVAPTGRIVVRDRGRVLARGTLEVADRGRLVLRLPRLKAGRHVLTAAYDGSPAVRPSASRPAKVRVR